jgi:hypothetical protein
MYVCVHALHCWLIAPWLSDWPPQSSAGCAVPAHSGVDDNSGAAEAAEEAHVPFPPHDEPALIPIGEGKNNPGTTWFLPSKDSLLHGPVLGADDHLWIDGHNVICYEESIRRIDPSWIRVTRSIHRESIAMMLQHSFHYLALVLGDANVVLFGLITIL